MPICSINIILWKVRWIWIIFNFLFRSIDNLKSDHLIILPKFMYFHWIHRNVSNPSKSIEIVDSTEIYRNPWNPLKYPYKSMDFFGIDGFPWKFPNIIRSKVGKAGTCDRPQVAAGHVCRQVMPFGRFEQISTLIRSLFPLLLISILS